MKKWFLALLTTLMALMLSVASAENVPLASETEINPVLEGAVCQCVRLHLPCR